MSVLERLSIKDGGVVDERGSYWEIWRENCSCGESMGEELGGEREEVEGDEEEEE